VLLQPVAPHLSTVQAMPSSHEASPQQGAHTLLLSQQDLPAGQSYLHTPCSHRPQPFCRQSAASSHSTCFEQPWSALHTSPAAHSASLGVLAQARRAPVQVSTVQPTPSSHSMAEQQLPQLALVPSRLGQHLSLPSQRATF
jgi:hypothetical protein